MKKKVGLLEVVLDDVFIIEEIYAMCPDLKGGAYIRLSVKDTGEGIEKDSLILLFDPYFTAKKLGRVQAWDFLLFMVLSGTMTEI